MQHSVLFPGWLQVPLRGVCCMSHLTFATREMSLFLHECSRLWSYRSGITKHPWQCLGFSHKPELTPVHSPSSQRAEIIPIPDIPRRDEPNLPREHTSVHHSPLHSIKARASHGIELSARKHWNFSTIKYLAQICQSFLHFFPVVLGYIWWNCVSKHTIPSVISIKHADIVTFLEKESEPPN